MISREAMRTALLEAAAPLAQHDKVGPDTTPTGAYETKFTGFDSAM